MARSYFAIEKGLRVSAENSADGFNIIFGDSWPGGDAGDQDGSEIGTLYIQQGSSPQLLQKLTNNGNTYDWVPMGTSALNINFSWRNEKVIVATTESPIPNDTDRNLVSSPFVDDNGTKITTSDFVLGNYIIFGVNNDPVLKKVTVINGNVIQVSDVDVTTLSDNDTFVIRNYLPNADPYEKQVIINYRQATNSFVKISDFSWDIAENINLTSDYSALAGTVYPGDSVNTAIKKLDGNIGNVDFNITAIGNTVGTYNQSTKLGTFSGTTIPDNTDIKSALQSLESGLESVSGSNSTINLDLTKLKNTMGTYDSVTKLGTFTGSTIPDNSDVKSAFQTIETSFETLNTSLSNLSSQVTTNVYTMKSSGSGNRVVDEVSVDQVYACKWIVQG